MTYERMLSGLPDASTTFKGHIQITPDELISIHIYLDDLIVYIKGLIITSEVSSVMVGSFQNRFCPGY
jgi:hypothetical protein